MRLTRSPNTIKQMTLRRNLYSRPQRGQLYGFEYGADTINFQTLTDWPFSPIGQWEWELCTCKGLSYSCWTACSTYYTLLLSVCRMLSSPTQKQIKFIKIQRKLCDATTRHNQKQYVSKHRTNRHIELRDDAFHAITNNRTHGGSVDAYLTLFAFDLSELDVVCHCSDSRSHPPTKQNKFIWYACEQQHNRPTGSTRAQASGTHINDLRHMYPMNGPV